MIIWKDIREWEDYYEVSKFGDVRNKQTGKLITGDVNSAGYQRVCLYNKAHQPSHQRFFRHRLVAEHFIPNPDRLPEVNHIDNNKSNNNKDNLEWVTRKENEVHAHVIGVKEYKPFVVEYNNGHIEKFDVKQDFADKIGVTRATVKFWLHNKNKGYSNYGINQIKYI